MRRNGTMTPCQQCGEAMYVNAYQAKTGKKYCSKQCLYDSRRGKTGETWVNGRNLTRGYVELRIAPTVRVLEHRYVMEQILGRPLLPGEIVHHIDGNKANNLPDNLALLSSQAEHMKQHVLPPDRWSRKYDACIKCGTTTIKYEGHGLCMNCYAVERYHRKHPDAGFR